MSIFNHLKNEFKQTQGPVRLTGSGGNGSADYSAGEDQEETMEVSAAVSISNEQVEALEKQVKRVIAQRKKDVSAIDEKLRRVEESLGNANNLCGLLDEVASLPNAVSVARELQTAQDEVKMLIDKLCEQACALKSLKLEFENDYLVEGISGETGAGKSQTLQSLTGLSNEQIPAGADGLPITAVRTEYINSDKEVAEVSFRSPESFMDDYVSPRYEIVKDAGGCKGTIPNLNAFREANWLDTQVELGEKQLEAKTCLLELQQARRSLEHFEKYLTGDTRNISLDKIAYFNTYPDSNAVVVEDACGEAPMRLYLAVDSVKVRCPFPGMGSVPLALVDLPGLGEASEEVARAHVRDLDHRVDHITVIASANSTRAHFSQGIKRNLNNLMKIQPGIKKRSDLIGIAVNEFKDKEEAAALLQGQIAKNLNGAARTDEVFSVDLYSAIDPTSVHGLFFESFERLAERLPELDLQKIEYACNVGAGHGNVTSCLSLLQRNLSRLRNSVPSPRSLKRKRIEELSGRIVQRLTDLDVSYRLDRGVESDAFAQYRKQVGIIHDNMAGRIDAGLMMSSEDEWNRRALGQKNHYEFYLNECDRLMCELVSAYCDLDIYYEDALNEFKQKVAGTLIDSSSQLRCALEAEAPDASSLDLIQAVLVPMAQEHCLSASFDFLVALHFDFFGNVLHRIESSMTALRPAPEFVDAESDMPLLPNASAGKRPHGKPVSKRQVAEHDSQLDGDRLQSIKQQLENPSATSRERVDCLNRFLKKFAGLANDAVERSLVSNKDYFNEFLSNALNFFCYRLYRSDQAAFDHGVIEAIVEEYGPELYGNDVDQGRDAAMLGLISEAQSCAASLMRHVGEQGATDAH